MPSARIKFGISNNASSAFPARAAASVSGARPADYIPKRGGSAIERGFYNQSSRLSRRGTLFNIKHDSSSIVATGKLTNLDVIGGPCFHVHIQVIRETHVYTGDLNQVTAVSGKRAVRSVQFIAPSFCTAQGIEVDHSAGIWCVYIPDGLVAVIIPGGVAGEQGIGGIKCSESGVNTYGKGGSWG